MTKKELLLRMQSDELSLFPPKEKYRMTHTARGKNIYFAQLPDSEQRKMRYENIHLLNGLKTQNGIPVVAPYTGSLDFKAVPFTERAKYQGKGEILHFFLYDYKFAIIWHNLEHITRSLCKFDCLFAPDFSLFVDDDKYQQINKEQVFRSRLVAAYWQQCGYQVIPTASWGDANSFKYCFEGLPENSVIAVCGIGHDQDKSHKKLWYAAINRLIEEKKPTTLIIYGGKQEDYQQLPVKVKYIPDFINEHLREL